jgi:hypothetical protein
MAVHSFLQPFVSSPAAVAEHLLDTAVANIFAQPGATIGEAVLGVTIRPFDAISVEFGERPVMGNLEYKNLWEVVQTQAFNPLYRHWADEIVESASSPREWVGLLAPGSMPGCVKTSL